MSISGVALEFNGHPFTSGHSNNDKKNDNWDIENENWELLM